LSQGYVILNNVGPQQQQFNGTDPVISSWSAILKAKVEDGWPATQRLTKGAASLACFFCCLIAFFSFGVDCGFFLLCFGG
jgi:hypothetical protein